VIIERIRHTSRIGYIVDLVSLTAWTAAVQLVAAAVELVAAAVQLVAAAVQLVAAIVALPRTASPS
jgi:hypothetical protein